MSFGLSAYHALDLGSMGAVSAHEQLNGMFLHFLVGAPPPQKKRHMATRFAMCGLDMAGNSWAEEASPYRKGMKNKAGFDFSFSLAKEGRERRKGKKKKKRPRTEAYSHLGRVECILDPLLRCTDM